MVWREGIVRRKGMVYHDGLHTTPHATALGLSSARCETLSPHAVCHMRLRPLSPCGTILLSSRAAPAPIRLLQQVLDLLRLLQHKSQQLCLGSICLGSICRWAIFANGRTVASSGARRFRLLLSGLRQKSQRWRCRSSSTACR